MPGSKLWAGLHLVKGQPIGGGSVFTGGTCGKLPMGTELPAEFDQ